MTKEVAFNVLHLFAGLGGGALGFQRARAALMGWQGSFRTLAGVDFDAGACSDFEALTGAPCARADLATMQPAELLAACQGERPDVVFLSPPCKGFSGLLPKARLAEEKYIALNRLLHQALNLVLTTWADRPPQLILVENVPRIVSRGAELLRQARSLLSAHGYAFHEGTHDCGELGGLGQRRTRFLMIARHAPQLPVFVYHPPKQRVRSIGEVIGDMPLPDDPSLGPLHALPRLSMMTWLRLALVPAGGDWRALGTTRDGTEYHGGAYGIVPWSEASGTVCGASRPGNGSFSVADPRLTIASSRPDLLGVLRWDRPAKTISGQASASGSNCAASVADPRGARFNNVYRVVRWDEASVAVTGGTGPSAGGLAVSDPRFTHGTGAHHNKFSVVRWGEPAATVIGADRVGSGAPSVADPRWTAEDRPDQPPVIIADDGTWHRPLTTLELAAIQGLPLRMRDGSPLRLAGKSHGAWRERIGNAVPPPTAQAIAGSILEALVANAAGATFRLGSGGVWVSEDSHAG